MKPPEILSMIEEAAGTRMFETKKQAALKTIEKKQMKVDEITRVIEDDIGPKLLQLRGEAKSYQEWNSNNGELERLEHICLAHDYVVANEKVQNSENEQNAMKDEIHAMKESQKALDCEVQTVDSEISALETKREEEQEGAFHVLKKKEQDLSKEVVKINSTFSNQKTSLKSEKELSSSLFKQLESTEAAVVEKKEKIDICRAQLDEKNKQVSLAEDEANALRTKYQNACAGVTDESDAALLSLPEQVATWEKKAREAQSKLQSETMKVKHHKDRLVGLKKNAKTEQTKHSKELKELEVLQGAVHSLDEKCKELSYSEEEEVSLRSACGSLQSDLVNMQDAIENTTVQVESRLKFEFRDPQRGFDRSRVKGLVAKLVHVNDKVHATALEVAAGGKLFQVVVDNEQTGKLLLGEGILKRRVTILPLNKISNRTVDAQKLNLAKEKAASTNGTAHMALELIGYEDEVQRAMQHVFGNTIICDSSATAEAIAFDKNIRCKTITLEGDTYDPSGTISGGSKNSLGSLLTKISDLATMKADHNSGCVKLAQMEKQLETIESNGSKLRKLEQSLELKKNDLAVCEDQMSESSYAQMNDEIKQVELEIKNFENDISKPLTAAAKKANDELKKLTDAAAGIKKQRETAMKDMEKATKVSQKKVTAIKSEAGAINTQHDKLLAEYDSLVTEVKSINEQHQICEKGIKRLSDEVEKLEASVNAKRAEYDAAKQEVASMNTALQQYAKEIKSLTNTRESKKKEIQKLSLESRKMEHKLDEWKKDIKNATRRVHEMEKKHAWINEQKEFFDMKDSAYDFESVDMDKSGERLKQLKSAQDKLSKKINKKVMGMIDKAEAENDELLKKKQVIINDKEKIESVITELDVKKVQALQTTWIKVNKDFGSIFSTLLPGTHAKLETPEGCTVMDGLEVKVAFNGVWKDSLTELSGGQRSLLALSLILALLLFKPAPMYILDEVDAALDLSHTQNIGLMLRTHFSGSQFIVVSLKEGMFNNANVIYRTKFIDGVSTVTRNTANSGKQKPLAVTDGNKKDKTANSGPAKKKSKNVASSGIENSNVI
jgi:structural maintenance of chromosome 2